MSDFAWHCNEIQAQADLFGGHLEEADASAPVPTCGAELRGPVTDLLLVLCRRTSVHAVEVVGDAGLVDFWIERVAFA